MFVITVTKMKCCFIKLITSFPILSLKFTAFLVNSSSLFNFLKYIWPTSTPLVFLFYLILLSIKNANKYFFLLCFPLSIIKPRFCRFNKLFCENKLFFQSRIPIWRKYHSTIYINRDIQSTKYPGNADYINHVFGLQSKINFVYGNILYNMYVELFKLI